MSRKSIIGLSVTGVVILILIIMISVFSVMVEPGYVGIKINKYGSSRGVEDMPIVTGKVWYNPVTTMIVKYPIFLQTVSWTKDSEEALGSDEDDSVTINSIEGAYVNVDVGFSYKFDPMKIPEIYSEFRVDPKLLTWGYIRNQVRDAFSIEASKMKAVDIMGEGKSGLLVKVKDRLSEILIPKGIIPDTISFIGKPRLDPNVEASINAVITASNKANEAEQKIRQITFEAKQKTEAAEGEAKAILINAKAQAEANKLIISSITELYIKYLAINKWGGELPKVTGGSIPLVDLK